MSAAVVRDLPVANIGIVRDFLAQTVAEHIHIVVIPPDGQPLPYGFWLGRDVEEAASFAVRENAKGYNVYWTVNIVRRGYDHKPKKEHIDAARFAHVDVDPPKDGSRWDRAEALEALRNLDIRPSFILDSGNGLQAFWRLDKYVEHWAPIERLNRRISKLLGGDNCHNIDRLMRLPGTVNYPDAKKRARGRLPVLSTIIDDDAGEIITIDELDRMLPVLSAENVGTREDIALDEVVTTSLEELGITSVDPLFTLITNTDPAYRSETVMSVAGKLVRRGKSDAEIAGILLNPAYKISEHCYDQSDPVRSAKRAIGRARADFAEDPGNAEPEWQPPGSHPKPPEEKQGPPPPPPTPQGEVSEDVIALAFTEKYRDTLRFDHDVGCWFRWTGAYWRKDTTDLAIDYARKFARDLGDGKRALCKASVASGAERFCRADRAHAVTHEIWDADPYLLGTPGGTVDLRTGYMTDPKPEDYISKQTAVTPEHGEPTLWLKFLHEAMAGDTEMVTFLQRWCGYCLTGDTTEHALSFAYGDGGNGKGVFMNTFTAILNDYAVTSGMETFTASRHDRHSTELAMLRGARLVTASETEEGRAWAESKIKSMTGGDPITARFMRQDNFTFKPQFKLMIAGNHAPSLRNVDDAMRRRFNIIPFTTRPEQPDRLLERKLQDEWGRILAWAIRGCREWMSDGLARPQAVLNATKEYFADQDLFGQWFEERTEQTPGRFDLCSKFYSDWVAFAKEHGEEPGSNKSFGQAMKKRGFHSELMRSSGIPGKVYKGLALILKDLGNDY